MKMRDQVLADSADVAIAVDTAIRQSKKLQRKDVAGTSEGSPWRSKQHPQGSMRSSKLPLHGSSQRGW